MENILIASRDKLIREGLLILSCEEDYTTCVPFLEKGRDRSLFCNSKWSRMTCKFYEMLQLSYLFAGVHVFNSELLLSGIVTQKLEYLR